MEFDVISIRPGGDAMVNVAHRNGILAKAFGFCFWIATVCQANAQPVPLWDTAHPVPNFAETTPLKNVRYEVIKERAPERDGYSWLHGVALACWGDRLYASFGLNQGNENTVTEEAGIVWSDDEGKTWSEVTVLDPGTDELAVSHGVFLPTDPALWAFQGAFSGSRQDVHMRAYRLVHGASEWESLGVVARSRFWPMGEPALMENGRWIMAGFQVGVAAGETRNPPAVAISQGDDLLRWEVIGIPEPEDSKMWGESAVIVDSATITCIARNDRDNPVAWTSTSADYGRTWQTLRPSNLPMVASKPYAGVLSTGQRYLVCTTTADSANRRYPLTIAVGKPGSNLFSTVYRITGFEKEDSEPSRTPPALSYPYAIEHRGCLYIGFSNDRGLGGNRNCAELAVIPIEELKGD